MALKCELPGGLFRKCDTPACGVCKWCGRPYCPDHRSIPVTSQPVCNSEICTAKSAFATTVESARQTALARNKEGLCGYSGCGNRLPGATCLICGSEYCTGHLSARLFRLPPTAVDKAGEAKRAPKKERFFVCDHCVGLVDRQGIIDHPTRPAVQLK
ncbi:MAG: hypothetical protein Q7O66_05310 [Dehalococcoidia bacterium]|nr:hypothetical protein [Dehalococcoidia bacterium]